MLTKLQSHLQKLMSDFPQNPWIVLPIIAASAVIIANRWVPEDMFLVLVLLNVSTTFFNSTKDDAAFSLWQPRSYLFKVLTLLAAGGLYAVHLLTYSPALLFSAEQVLILWTIYNGLQYATSKEQYISYMVHAFRQGLVAFTYFAVVYGIIYLIAFFVNNIFNLNLFANSYLHHFAFALALLIGMLVLFSLKYEESLHGGPFFTTLFGKLIPKLSLLAGVLATIYLGQMLFGFRPDMQFFYSYYPYIIFFYVAFVLSFHANVEHKERNKLLLIFCVLTALTMAFIVKRQVTIPSQQISSIYSLIVNALFFAYNIYLLKTSKPIGTALTKLVLAIALVVCMPVVGFFSYKEFVTYTGPKEQLVAHYDMAEIISKKDERNNLDRFARKGDARTAQAEGEGPNAVFFDSSREPSSLSVEGKANVYMQEQLEIGKNHQYGNILVQFSADGKVLELYENGTRAVTVPLYEQVKEQQEQKKKSVPIVVETEKVKLYVVQYQYYFDRNVQGMGVYHMVVKER